MKRFCALTTALCLFFSNAPATAENPGEPRAPLPGYTLRHSAEEVKVFAAPNMKANIVGYIIPGGQQQVDVLSVSGEWCYVGFTSIYGTSYGYLPLAFFDVAATPSPTPVPTTTYAAGTPVWIVNALVGSRLNLREAASSSAKSLGKYYTGTPAVLTGASADGFVQVLVAERLLGWVDARFITTNALSFVPELPMLTIHNPGSGATLRSGPGTINQRVGWYEHGTMLTVLGVRADGWYHVMIGNQVGYIAETLLSGTLSYTHGTDSDNPLLSSPVNDEMSLYINTRSTGGQLNLRKSASVSAKSLGLFYTGTPLTVINYTRDGWAYVRIGCTEGYLDADYLTATKPTQYGQPYAVRNSRATGLNLRSLPSTGGEILGFAPNYSTVIVLGELSDGWCYVQFDDTVGYMLGTYLKKTK